ncbi:heme ABC exporter ATP-binding protein CcmA [Chengkuizengella marina]|uniref:Heme ABC exporter ATP-binding protein CcmA n=1 Tax=Chengkuizengella marina TaxID=2507566 RepID=A0A6N9Q408_9BACL|nr:heme ABC exporter ATP-binding protein CcmA [Chengkuizengella marina]NBI29542.1 heme ABC exporter ATP-binding protein CcmA [Chengkuizengella marina]
MIKTVTLNKTIAEKTILNDINITVNQGETIGILGPNGAGKSTILKIIGGLMKPSFGHVMIDNIPVKENNLEIKKKIGFLAHNSYLYEHLSPVENLTFFGKLYQVNQLEYKVKELIREVGLQFFMNEPVRSFSRGMIQRLAIVRAIVHDPSILILDEPHTGLDQQASRILNELILKKKEQKTTILMVTHDLAQAIETCDRFILMKKGVIIDDFVLENKNVHQLKEIYLRQVG